MYPPGVVIWLIRGCPTLPNCREYWHFSISPGSRLRMLGPECRVALAADENVRPACYLDKRRRRSPLFCTLCMAPAAMTIAIKTCVGLATLTFAYVMPHQGRRREGARSHRNQGQCDRAVSWGVGGARLGKAKKLGVPANCALLSRSGPRRPRLFEFLPHLASGEIQNSAASGKWDVTFMPVDEERKKFVDFGNAYHLLQSTYLVTPGARLANVDDANAPGVRIGGVANTATFRAAQRTAPKATFVAVPGVDAAVAAMKAGEIDCIALSRESLSGLAPKIPGSRILDGGFLNSSTAVAVPKGRPEALVYVSQFVEEAKSSGLVRKAFDA